MPVHAYSTTTSSELVLPTLDAPDLLPCVITGMDHAPLVMERVGVVAGITVDYRRLVFVIHDFTTLDRDW